MISRFEELLQELGKEVDLPLHPDHNGACRLNFPDGAPTTQIEFDERKAAVVIAAFVGDVPVGKFREKVFKAGLRQNERAPEGPILSFSSKNTQLCVSQFVPIDTLDVHKFQEILTQFLENANDWKKGVETGDLPTGSAPSKPGEPGLFGVYK